MQVFPRETEQAETAVAQIEAKHGLPDGPSGIKRVIYSVLYGLALLAVLVLVISLLSDEKITWI